MTSRFGRVNSTQGSSARAFAYRRARRSLRIVGISQREHQYRTRIGYVVGAPAKRAGYRDIGDLEVVDVGVDLGPLGDLVDRFESDAEKADLRAPFGGLPDAGHADQVPGAERGTVVPHDESPGLEAHAPGGRPGVLGVLQQLDEEMSRIGVDAPRKQLLGVGLGDRLGRVSQDVDRAAGQLAAPSVEALAQITAEHVGARAQLDDRLPRELRELLERDRLDAIVVQRGVDAGDDAGDVLVAQPGEVVFESSIDQAERGEPRERYSAQRLEQRVSQLGAPPVVGGRLERGAHEPVDGRLGQADEEVGEEGAPLRGGQPVVLEQPGAQPGQRRPVAQRSAQLQELGRARGIGLELVVQVGELVVERACSELLRGHPLLLGRGLWAPGG